MFRIRTTNVFKPSVMNVQTGLGAAGGGRLLRMCCRSTTLHHRHIFVGELKTDRAGGVGGFCLHRRGQNKAVRAVLCGERVTQEDVSITVKRRRRWAGESRVNIYVGCRNSEDSLKSGRKEKLQVWKETRPEPLRALKRFGLAPRLQIFALKLKTTTLCWFA